VLTYEEEREYLFACPEPLRDFATLMLETGMRPVEVRALRVEDVHLTGDQAWLHVRQSKTEASRRDLFSLSGKAVEVLRKRIEMAENGILFFETRGHVDNRHVDVLKTIPHIKPFRIYDLRHTFATRQVECGTDLPTLSALLGHANIKETMRYAHPSDLHKSAAMGRMDEMRRQWEEAQKAQKVA
jgi:integrase